MSLLKAEPFAAVETMDELLAIAYAMEQEAVAGYSELAIRMRRESRPDLAAVFDRLVGEENEHLGNVVSWSETVSGKPPDLSKLRWKRTGTFDDEGARTIAPELLSAYRAFSMAVRNEERAFLFWTYVAAQAVQEELRRAAERMAREELAHLATMRRERRRAFHAQDRTRSPAANQGDLAVLEHRLAELLQATATGASANDAAVLTDLALQSQRRAESLAGKPLGESPLLRGGVATDVVARMVPLCELLLDCYLDLGERLPDEAERNRAQDFAAAAVQCRSALRLVAD
jgi:rubrerythrin